MKRCFFLLSFFLVIFSQATSIVAGVFICSVKMEMVEKEKSGKEIDNELDLEKEKIFQNNIAHLNFLTSAGLEYLHREAKISSLVLDADINPPDRIVTC